MNKGSCIWASLLLGATACVSDNGASDGGTEAAVEDAPGMDTSMMMDGSAADAPPGDAPADSPQPTTYYDVTNKQNWSEYVLTDNNAFGANGAKGFAQAVFANKSVYFLPMCCNYGNRIAFRYDTTGSFTTKGSWTTYDTTAQFGSASGATAAIFDGKFISIASNAKIAVRYDTTQPFASAGSWSSYDFSSTFAGGLNTAGFDTKNFYVLSYDGAVGTVVRYDTTQSFTTSGSWSAYDISQPDGGASSFHYLTTTGFDGSHFFVAQGASATGSLIARYDVATSFADPTHWPTFDATQVISSAKGFYGAIFDGKYMYFPPASFNVASGSTVRYDTTKPFQSASSWEGIDLTSLDANATTYVGGTFDGRYVYYAPHNTSGLLVRYDTTMPFTQAGSWQKFAVPGVTSAPAVHSGVAFDGEYVYLVPQAQLNSSPLGSISIPRFHAKSPPSLSAFTPSFR